MASNAKKKRGRPCRCPKCRSTRSHSKGFQYYADGHTARDRKCLECGRRYLI